MLYLPHLTAKEAEAAFKRTDFVVVTTGSVESHGPHLCNGTDYLVAEEISKRVAADADVVLVPPLPFGYSSNHAVFAGTISLRPDIFRGVIDDICSSLHAYGARRFLFVNGHSGNTGLLQESCDHLRKMRCIGCIANWWSLAGSLSEEFTGTGHGDYMEAAAMLAVAPHAVHMDRAVAYTPKSLTPDLHVLGWDRLEFKGGILYTWISTRQASDTGSTGKLDGASAERGERAIEAIASYLIELVAELRKVDLQKID
jgi:creatinine amidohydrolase